MATLVGCDMREDTC